MNNCYTEKQPKRGRPRNDNKLHGIRCNEEEFLAIKDFLKKYRAKKLSEADRIKKLEAAGQKTLKF
jgi:hypothetical protein